MKHLELTEDDSILVITSAGDNALHYAIEASPKRVSHIPPIGITWPCLIHEDSLRRHEPVVGILILVVLFISLVLSAKDIF